VDHRPEHLGMPLSTTLFVALGAAAAGFVQGLSGFAFGLVALSFWAWVIDPKLAAALAVAGAFTGQVIAALSVRRGFDIRSLAPFLAGGLAGVPLGILLLPHLDVTLFKMLLGLLLVVWCPAMLLSKDLPRITLGGRLADAFVGMSGGILSGLGGFSGTLPTLWCTLRGYDRDLQRAIIQNFNLAMLGVTLTIYILSGVVTRETVPMLAIVLPSMLIPTLIGTRVYIGISEASFRRIVLALLTASGITLLTSSLAALAG